jgi:enterochelin esterase-like enzyme
LETDLLRQPLDYRVYLPPCYDELPDESFPALYLIHGQSFTDDQWERLGAPEIVDRLSPGGELPPFIIVMPRDRLWLEPADDPFGQALVEVLVPYVDSTYRTIPERTSRAVGGLSRGGAWALHLGLNHPELFGALGMHSGFAFQSDIAHIKRWLDAIPLEKMPRFFIDVSDNDRPEIAQSAAWFERLLTDRGIPHEWYLFPGYHEEAYWSAHVEQYLRWYAEDW